MMMSSREGMCVNFAKDSGGEDNDGEEDKQENIWK